MGSTECIILIYICHSMRFPTHIGDRRPISPTREIWNSSGDLRISRISSIPNTHLHLCRMWKIDGTGGIRITQINRLFRVNSQKFRTSTVRISASRIHMRRWKCASWKFLFYLGSFGGGGLTAYLDRNTEYSKLLGIPNVGGFGEFANPQCRFEFPPGADLAPKAPTSAHS